MEILLQIQIQFLCPEDSIRIHHHFSGTKPNPLHDETTFHMGGSWITGKRVHMYEALPGGYLFPCSPEINWLVPLFPKNRKCVFFMFRVRQYCLCSPVPLKIWPLFPCSPEIKGLFPLFPKTPGRASCIKGT